MSMAIIIHFFRVPFKVQYTHRHPMSIPMYCAYVLGSRYYAKLLVSGYMSKGFAEIGHFRKCLGFPMQLQISMVFILTKFKLWKKAEH